MSTPTDISAPATPKALKALTLIASLGAGLGSAACLYVALAGAEQVLWGSAGFLIVMLIATLFGVLLGLGKFRTGYGMGAFATAATILGGAIFAWRDLASNVGRDPDIGPKLMPWLGFEAICAIVILLAGGATVLARQPRSWRFFGKGMLYLVPAAILLMLGYIQIFVHDEDGGRLFNIPTEDGGRAIALGLLIAGGAIIGVLVSIGGHCVIRAFEITADEPAG